MNSLVDIVKAIREMINLVGTAHQAGMSDCLREVQKGNALAERIRIERDSSRRLILFTENKSVYLDLGDFGALAKDLDMIYFVACKAAEYLNKKLDDFKSVQETLAPFILQEKLS